MTTNMTRLLRWKRMENPLLIYHRCDGGVNGTDSNNEHGEL